MQDGTEYDLGPGLVPIVRPARIQESCSSGLSHISAKDLDDAQRILTIAKKRGLNIQQTNAKFVSENAPVTHIKIAFDGSKLSRSLAKTALTAACVMYGNTVVRRKASWRICLAAKDGDPNITEFAGWDYWNAWPTKVKLRPHKRSTNASVSGFEHAIYLTDVERSWVAYISLFGDFRFTVWLGQASGLKPRGLAVNPRALKYSRFECDFQSPETFSPHWNGRFAAQFQSVSQSVTESINKVLSRWQSESRSQLDDERDKELAEAIASVGDDQARRAQETVRLLSKWAAIERGARWEEDLDSVVLDSDEK